MSDLVNVMPTQYCSLQLTHRLNICSGGILVVVGLAESLHGEVGSISCIIASISVESFVDHANEDKSTESMLSSTNELFEDCIEGVQPVGSMLSNISSNRLLVVVFDLL